MNVEDKVFLKVPIGTTVILSRVTLIPISRNLSTYDTFRPLSFDEIDGPECHGMGNII